MKLLGNEASPFKSGAHTCDSAILLTPNLKRYNILLSANSTNIIMLLSTLLDRQPLKETTLVEEIMILPDLLVPLTSPNPISDEEQFELYFDNHVIMDNGNGVFWIEERTSSDEYTDNLSTLPGSAEEETEERETSFNQVEPITVEEPVFSLLPNGRRKKKTLWRKVRDTLFRRSSYRRAAYAVDSRATKLSDGIAVSSTKVQKSLGNMAERLRPNEDSWTNLEDLFAGTNNHFIPFLNMGPTMYGV